MILHWTNKHIYLQYVENSYSLLWIRMKEIIEYCDRSVQHDVPQAKFRRNHRFSTVYRSHIIFVIHFTLFLSSGKNCI
jgi:hypothetical protein